MGEKMIIVATTVLNEKEGNSIVGELSYLTWYDENAIIDYDYLNGRKEFLENWVHDKLTSSSKYKNLYNVTLIVKYWRIGRSILIPENNRTLQIRELIFKEDIKFDEI